MLTTCSNSYSAHNFKEPYIFAQSSDASTEGDEEHDHPHHNENHSRINEERVTHCVCGEKKTQKKSLN